MARNSKQLTIGVIFIQNALGECVIGLESLYALKHIYSCKLIVFAQPTLQNLLRECDFVDVVEPCTKQAIDAYACDYALLTNSKTTHIRFALSTNAKRIVCATKFASLFSWRCKSVAIYMWKKYRNYDEREILLAFARAINPKLYDEKFPLLDLTQSKLPYGKKHAQVVQDHLAKEFAHKGLESSKPYYLIMINPFNNACPYSLTKQGFITLIDKIAQIPECIPLVVTFEKVHKDFMQELESSLDSTPPPPQPQNTQSKLIVFCNDNDLLQLSAWIDRASCVISPSTGTLHLACNQRVPTIALYPEYDTRRWATHNKRYVFLHTPRSSITTQEEQEAIAQTIAMLRAMISNGELESLQLESSQQ